MTNQDRVSLSPDRAFAAAALDVLLSLSRRSLSDLRAGTDRTYTSAIPRKRLRDLAEALNALWPGVLDEAIRLADETDK